MCLAQEPKCSDAGEAWTRGLSVSSQALYHWATALPIFIHSELNLSWHSEFRMKKKIFDWFFNSLLQNQSSIIWNFYFISHKILKSGILLKIDTHVLQYI